MTLNELLVKALNKGKKLTIEFEENYGHCNISIMLDEIDLFNQFIVGINYLFKAIDNEIIDIALESGDFKMEYGASEIDYEKWDYFNATELRENLGELELNISVSQEITEENKGIILPKYIYVSKKRNIWEITSEDRVLESLFLIELVKAKYEEYQFMEMLLELTYKEVDDDLIEFEYYPENVDELYSLNPTEGLDFFEKIKLDLSDDQTGELVKFVLGDDVNKKN